MEFLVHSYLLIFITQPWHRLLLRAAVFFPWCCMRAGIWWNEAYSRRALLLQPMTQHVNTMEPEGEPSVKEAETKAKQQPGLTCSQTLLVVHQEKRQKQLLERYGSTMSMLNTTYKKMTYELALFFLCVWTSVGYSMVAVVIVQEESTENTAARSTWCNQAVETLLESLLASLTLHDWLLRGWAINEQLSNFFQMPRPSFAISIRNKHGNNGYKTTNTGLPNSEDSWTTSTSPGLFNWRVFSNPSLGYLVDHSFRQRVTELKDSPQWENDDVKQWLSTKWLCCAEAIVIPYIMPYIQNFSGWWNFALFLDGAGPWILSMQNTYPSYHFGKLTKWRHW